MDCIILKSKVSNVSPISTDDLTVHIFINSLSDSKLKENILEINRVDGNIPISSVISAIKSYDANILISLKINPPTTPRRPVTTPETAPQLTNAQFAMSKAM